MCNKMKFTKTFPRADMIPFKEGAIREQPLPTLTLRWAFLVVGWICQGQ